MKSTYLLLVLVSVASADQITMKNGDRISGSVIKTDGKNLMFKSEYAGPIALPWEAIVSVTSSEPVYLGLKNGQVVNGILALSADKAEVETKEAGKLSINRADVEFLRSKAEQTAFETQIERYRHPRLVDLWAGFVDLGVSQARGNSSTSSITTTANATRVTPRDTIGVNFTSIYASNKTTGTSLVTANAIRGGVKYELNITPTVFAFASTDLEYDEFQGLDLRFAPAGGGGAHLWKTPKRSFDVMGGISLNREFFATGLKRTSTEALLGQEFIYKFTERTSFREKLVFFPNMSNTGNYRLNFDTSLVTAIRRWLGFQVTVSDRYLSNPILGRKKNDTLFTTGFRLTFTQ